MVVALAESTLEGQELLEARMKKFVFYQKSDKRSVWFFKGVFPFGELFARARAQSPALDVGELRFRRPHLVRVRGGRSRREGPGAERLVFHWLFSSVRRIAGLIYIFFYFV